MFTDRITIVFGYFSFVSLSRKITNRIRCFFLPVISSGNSKLSKKLQIFLQPTTCRFFLWGWNIGTAIFLPDRTDSNFAAIPLSWRSVTSCIDTQTVSRWMLAHFARVRLLITLLYPVAKGVELLRPFAILVTCAVIFSNHLASG